jgi:hypothetical protein
MVYHRTAPDTRSQEPRLLAGWQFVDFEKHREECLRQILGIVRCVTRSPEKGIQRHPVSFAKQSQGSLPRLRVPRTEYEAPMRRLERAVEIGE